MFASSSRSPRKQNQDGTWNVFCYQCGRFISASVIRIHRALCAICDAAERGVPLPVEFLREYEASKLSKADVGSLNLPAEPSLEGVGFTKRKMRFATVAGELIRAAGRFALGQQTTEEKRAQQPSAKLAKEKRRPRLFSKPLSELEQKSSLGTMQDIDNQLKPKP
ncbi:MAG: hypothetical protein KGL39_22205 [Patescibacteria group bacterium]|nr:hypothetical protein [Patescibacteria group bacterium]